MDGSVSKKTLPLLAIVLKAKGIANVNCKRVVGRGGRHQITAVD